MGGADTTGGRSAQRRCAGFSYLEVLVAVMLLAVALVPALEALQTSIQGAGIGEELEVGRHHLLSRVEEVLALPFTGLASAAMASGGPGTPSTLSDAPSAERRRLVYLAFYDADDADGDGNSFTGGEPDLIWVRVAFERPSLAIETLTYDD